MLGSLFSADWTSVWILVDQSATGTLTCVVLQEEAQYREKTPLMAITSGGGPMTSWEVMTSTWALPFVSYTTQSPIRRAASSYGAGTLEVTATGGCEAAYTWMARTGTPACCACAICGPTTRGSTPPK